MFENLEQAPPDKILSLIGLYRDDPRPAKVDLGVGVYRDAHNNTPIMSALRVAEQKLHDSQTSKAYTGLAGDLGFNHLIGELTLGNAVGSDRMRVCQTPGGSGALHILSELVARSNPSATIWLPDPTWANHRALLGGTGLPMRSYPYFDAQTGAVKFEEMIDGLAKVPRGDIILLHGCCHNPTGANLDNAQWRQLTALMTAGGLLPFVDIAYQGFGDGLEQDAAGVRMLAKEVPEMVVAVSCSKNFSVYRERTGAAIVIASNATQAGIAFSQLLSNARANYSMAPDHGAAIVGMVLDDTELRAQWQAELEGMRTRMLTLREKFSQALRRRCNSSRFDFVASHRGMFSRLGLTPQQVTILREKHAIYMVDDSRINVAGLPDNGLDEVAIAVASVLDG